MSAVTRAAPPDSAAATRPARVDGATWLALAALTSLGAALRLSGLDVQSLWSDELSSVSRLSPPRVLALLGSLTPPDHMPGYGLLMYVWSHAIGDSEALLRLPSALCGIATVPAMFALGRRWYGSAEGLIAAGITAVAWLPVAYSQEARPYAWLLLAAVLSTAALTDVVAALHAGTTPRRVALAAYVIAAGATVYAHYFGAMTVVVQAAIAVVSVRARPRARWTLAAVYAAILILCVPCVLHAWLVPPRGPDWIPTPDARALWTQFLFYFNRSDAIAWLVLIVWALALARSVARRTRPAPATLLLVAWLVGPVASLYVYSQLVAPRLLDRTLIVVAPAAYLLLARALTRLPFVRVTAPALLGVLLVHLVVAMQYYTRPVKEQFRQAAAYVVAHDDPGSAPLLLACTGNRTYFDYYFAHMGSPRRIDKRIVTDHETAAALALVAQRQPSDLWLLAGHRHCEPAFLAALAERMTLVDHQGMLGAAVWHFRRR